MLFLWKRGYKRSLIVVRRIYSWLNFVFILVLRELCSGIFLFNIFINNLGKDIEGIYIKFLDYIKLEIIVNVYMLKLGLR